jgi:uncharacterized protein
MVPSISRRIPATVLIIGFLSLPASALAFVVPPNDGFVTDTAKALTVAQERRLEQMLQAYERQTTNEVAVLLTSDPGSTTVLAAAEQVGRSWGVGKKDKNNGMVILVAVKSGQIAIVPGLGFAGVVPDAALQSVVDRQFVPAFKQGRYYQGLVRGIRLLEADIAKALRTART